MQNSIVIIYLSAVLLVGILAGRKITGLKEYAVAGKSFGAMVIFATLSASFIGGGFSMGNAEKVFLIGIANIVALWGFSLKEVLVALFIAPRMKHYPDAISVGDIMEPITERGRGYSAGCSVLFSAREFLAHRLAPWDTSSIFFSALTAPAAFSSDAALS